MTKKFILIKNALNSENLTINSVKQRTFINSDIELIKHLEEFLHYFIENVRNYNINSTLKYMNQILDFLFCFPKTTINKTAIENVFLSSLTVIASELLKNIHNKNELRILKEQIVLADKTYLQKPLVQEETEDDNFLENEEIGQANFSAHPLAEFAPHRLKLFSDIKDFRQQDTIIIDNQKTRISEQAYYITKDNEDCLLYVHISNITAQDLFAQENNKEKLLKVDKESLVYTFIFRLGPNGLFKSYEITPAIIKPHNKFWTYDLENLRKYNIETYKNILEVCYLLSVNRVFTSDIYVTLNSVLVNNLMGKIATDKNWNMIYFNPANMEHSSYHSFTPDCIDTPYATISAPIRRFVDRFNEQMLYHYLENNNLTNELWQQYLETISKQVPQIELPKKRSLLL